MKRRVISTILLIILFTLIILVPVEANILNDYEWNEDRVDYEFIWYDDTVVEEGQIVEYETVDDFLKEHYINYENIDKNSITTLYLYSDDKFRIKDYSDLEDFQNLKYLDIVLFESNIYTLNKLDLSKNTNLQALYLYNVDFNNLGLENITNLECLILSNTYDYNFNLDLRKMSKLKDFNYYTYFEFEDEQDRENINIAIENIKNSIIPIEGYELLIYNDGFGIDIYLIEKLNVDISTDKTAYNFGDKVTTTVSWDKGMQATDFEINFDASKLKLESASIDEDFYNLVEKGRILVSWASFEETDIQEITFKFSAIGDGQAEILVLPENFADGDLDTDFIFTEAKQVITIEKSGYVKPNKEITTTVIDNKETISGLKLVDNKVTLEQFLNEDNFISNIEVKVFDRQNNEITSSTKGVGTGSKVKLYENEQLVKEYDVVVYGDTSGDGKINTVDALTLIKGINQRVPFISELHKEAARIMTASGKEPKAYDALAIVKCTNNKYTINQSK